MRIDYCKRDVREVIGEIETYAGWAGLKGDGSNDPRYVPEKVSNAPANGRGEPAMQTTAPKENGDGLLKPTPKAKPWHLKTLQVLRDKSPFRRDRSKSPSPARSPLPSPRFANNQDGRGREYFGGGDESNSAANRVLNAGANPQQPQRRLLSMHGIFFDETPNINDPKHAEFLHEVTRAAKNTAGIGGHQLVSRVRSLFVLPLYASFIESSRLTPFFMSSSPPRI